MGIPNKLGRDYHRYGQSHQYQRYFVALFQSVDHIHQLKWELPLGVPQNLDTVYYTQTGFGLRELAVYGTITNS
jgi:hypothetical protein